MKLIYVLCGAALLWFGQAYGQIDNVNVEEVSHEPSTEATIESTETTDTTDTIDTTSRSTATANQCENGTECIPYYLCANGSIITSGEGILDVRIGAEDDPEPGQHPCSDFFETCCTHVSKEIITKTKFSISEKCGVRNKRGNGFEVLPRDNEAQFAEFPWVVAIIHRVHDGENVVNVYKCAGSLIHPSVVLTVSHCVIDLKPENMKVRCGEWDTQTSNEPFPHQDRKVTEIKRHEHYRPGSHFNDVALLILDKPVDLAENVNTVCLPPQDFNFDDRRCIATGWGKDKFGSTGLYQVILKKVELPVVRSDQCQKKLRTTRLGRFFVLDPSFICAGGESGKDTCQGDGGAPLICAHENNQNYQAGMVAWGIGCNDPIPGVYVNVAKFRNWIDDAMDNLKLEKKFYTL